MHNCEHVYFIIDLNWILSTYITPYIFSLYDYNQSMPFVHLIHIHLYLICAVYIFSAIFFYWQRANIRLDKQLKNS